MAMSLVALTVNDIDIKARFFKEDVSDVLLPFLKRLEAMYKAKGERVICYIAAGPGTGKSTLAAYLELLAKDNDINLQAVGIDGFHHYNAYLMTHHIDDDATKPLLATVKGAPDTFDARKLTDYISLLKKEEIVSWPHYSRSQHDPVEDVYTIKAPIVIIEGNYLLLDKDKWRDLRSMADYSLFLKADKEGLKEGLITRKAMSGISLQMSIEHYERVDSCNFDLVLSSSLTADMILNIDKDRHIREEICGRIDR